MKASELPDSDITIVGGILVSGPGKENLWFTWKIAVAATLALMGILYPIGQVGIRHVD